MVQHQTTRASKREKAIWDLDSVRHPALRGGGVRDQPVGAVGQEVELAYPHAPAQEVPGRLSVLPF